jgi:murein DD-endopeptidase MepM/ murein hydrolase activator NlpD
MLILVAGAATRSSGQFNEKVEQLSWSNGPTLVKVEVTRNADKFNFVAINDSFYPYEVEVQFKEFYNLKPPMGIETFVVRPGRNHLFDLTIANSNQGPRYSYNYKSRISPNLSKEVDEEYPYLLPLSKGKVVTVFRHGTDSIRIAGDMKLAPGDTVRAIRRGVITGAPGSSVPGECRLMSGSVEILHPDGSVAIYENVETGSFCRYGDRVLPGEPLGKMREGMPLRIRVVRLKDGNRFTSFVHKYAVDEEQTLPAIAIRDGFWLITRQPSSSVSCRRRRSSAWG